MSTARRLFEDPRNTYIVENDDPGAFDKRFIGRPGVHREQRCCRDCAPVWDTHRIHDDGEIADRNFSAYLKSDPLQVEDATSESDNIDDRRVVGWDTHLNSILTTDMKGFARVEGPKSGYRPEFISAEEWMRWQGVHWIPSPRGRSDLPNLPRWVRMPGERKVKGSGSGLIFLWCKKCETPLESIWSDVVESVPIAARGIAMIASSVPVFGTAVSYLINTTVSLAEGESIGQALLDGIGGALPYQPGSGIIFNAGISIAKGERIDHAFIDTLPIDNKVKDAIKVVDDLAYGIASGENVTDLVYQSIRDRLPPEAQKGMDIARGVIESGDLRQFFTEAELSVISGLRENAKQILEYAKAEGPEALKTAEAKVNAMYNEYAADTGYQMAIDRLLPEERGALSIGLVGGAALRSPQSIGTFGSVAEKNVEENDSWETKGKELIASGISYRFKRVSDIVTGSSFAISVDDFDLLNNIPRKILKTYQIDDAWRRGFAIAISVCDGKSARGPGQDKIYQTLAEKGGRAGFEAGQALQYSRTLHGELGMISDTLTNKKSLSIRAISHEGQGNLPTTAAERSPLARFSVGKLPTE
jgi:hypothetical protein